jgi:alkanesulfonate monooxygenase SsuD/methylene tetrahydromethanopterin reductase-like flavin-dependent oxidoreductase (luciferase family)
MRETIELCEAAWTEPSPVDYEGRHYSLDGLYLEPKPEDVPVLVGGGGEQLTLRATAEYADRWNIPGGDPEHYAGKLDVLREHCAELGRDYDAITKTVANVTVLRETTEEAHAAYETLQAGTEAGPTPRGEYRGVVGTPAEAAERVEAFADAGAEQFQLKVPANDRRTRELFVDEVAPAVG